MRGGQTVALQRSLDLARDIANGDMDLLSRLVRELMALFASTGTLAER